MAEITLDFVARPQQIEILDFVKSTFDGGKKYAMVDAPTGVGKSYAAIMISEWYREKYGKSAKVDIITNTKMLQDQYLKDFKFIGNLKGKSNYQCGKNKTNCGDAQILNKANGTRCNICPYKIAQQNFIKSPLSLTNFHLITAYSMYSPDMLAERKSKLLIIDEAHSFEESFCDFISSTFSERAIKALDVWAPFMERDLDNLSTIQELSDWVKNILNPLLESKLEELVQDAKSARSRPKKLEIAKKADHIDKTACKFRRFVEDKSNYLTNWIFEKELDNFGKVRVLVEPIWGNQYLEDYFWKEYDHVIFMSGTLLDKNLISFLMGIKDEESKYLALPCPFDAEKRPIIYAKFGKMSYYEKQETFKRAVPIMERILDKNKDHKGIIHTSNYELSRWISDKIKNKRLIFHDSKTREESLAKHLRSELNTIIVSPSMFTGVDLKDDFSRFQLILKIPFPNLISKKIKRRLEMKPEWYNWRTLIDLLQAYGRSIRNEDDWAETYILDECFDQILNNSSVPQYFLDALKVKKLQTK
jgi:ATP-dependent DNA helicase DinG